MDNNCLSHTKYNYKYHIVFAPKFKRKEIYRELKKGIGGKCQHQNVEKFQHENA